MISPMTRVNTSKRLAPRAMRMPISLRRCATELRHESVHADAREHERDDGETPEKTKRKAAKRQRPLDKVGHRAKIGHRQVLVLCMDLGLKRSGHLERITRTNFYRFRDTTAP
jgi:hypothetical protein